jgi:hypothetical protein
VAVVDLKRLDDDRRDRLLIGSAKHLAVKLRAVDADSARDVVLGLAAVIVLKAVYRVGHFDKRAQHDFDDVAFDQVIFHANRVCQSLWLFADRQVIDVLASDFDPQRRSRETGKRTSGCHAQGQL